MQNGFMVTTVMNREEKAFNEFSNSLARFSSASEEELTNLEDFSIQLQKELRAIKKSTNFSVEEKYKSILIVKNKTKKNPTEIFMWMRKSGLSFKKVLRVIPLDLITKFDEEKIQSFIKEHRFSGTYKVFFEGRLCRNDLKTDLFKLIIPLIQEKVSLDNPEYLIIIQAFKSLIGISVIENDKRNFNFSEFISD